MSLSELVSETESRVRPVERHDLAVVSGMIARLARQHGDEPSIDVARLEADLFGPTPWLHGLVVERCGFLVGYALMTSRYRAQLTERGLDLHHLFVLEGSRGLGLGRKLVISVVEFAREARCSFLVVGAAADNERAHRFYRALGFEPRDHAGRGFAMTLQ